MENMLNLRISKVWNTLFKFVVMPFFAFSVYSMVMENNSLWSAIYAGALCWWLGYWSGEWETNKWQHFTVGELKYLRGLIEKDQHKQEKK